MASLQIFKDTEQYGAPRRADTEIQFTSRVRATYSLGGALHHWFFVCFCAKTGVYFLSYWLLRAILIVTWGTLRENHIIVPISVLLFSLCVREFVCICFMTVCVCERMNVCVSSLLLWVLFFDTFPRLGQPLIFPSPFRYQIPSTFSSSNSKCKIMIWVTYGIKILISGITSLVSAPSTMTRTEMLVFLMKRGIEWFGTGSYILYNIKGINMPFRSSVFLLPFCLGTVFTLTLSLGFWQQGGREWWHCVLHTSWCRFACSPTLESQAREAQVSLSLSWAGRWGLSTQKGQSFGSQHFAAISVPLSTRPGPSGCPGLSSQARCSALVLFTYCGFLNLSHFLFLLEFVNKKAFISRFSISRFEASYIISVLHGVQGWPSST